MIKRLILLSMTVFLVAGLILAVPVANTPVSEPTAVAQANDCSAPGVCGRIHQRMGSGTSILISYDWDCGSTCRTRVLYNGQNSEWYLPDADGFWVSPGACVRLWKYDPYDGYWAMERVRGASGSGTWKKIYDQPYGTFWEIRWPC